MKHWKWVVLLFFCLAFKAQSTNAQSLDDAEGAYLYALVCMQKDQYAEAIQYARFASNIYGELMGREHADFANSINLLATLYRINGDYNNAEPLFLRVLQLSEKIYGREHAEVAKSQESLGTLYCSMGYFNDAEKLFKKALKIKEKVIGQQSLEVAQTINNLAEVYKTTADYKKAETLYEKALKIRESFSGTNDNDLDKSYSTMGEFFRLIGNYNKAETYLKKALRLREEMSSENGIDKIYIGIVHVNLGALYFELGDYKNAELSYKKALEICKKTNKTNNPEYASALNNLALLYMNLGSYNKAEKILNMVLENDYKNLGPKHHYIDIDLRNLAALYIKTQKTEEAFKIIQEIDDPRGVLLGSYYLAVGNYIDAEKEFRLSIEYHNVSYYFDRKVEDYIGLGLSCEGQKKYSEAKQHFKKAIKLIEEKRSSLSLTSRQNFINAPAGGFSRFVPYEGMIRVLIKERGSRYKREALYYAEKAKSKMFLDMLKNRNLPGKSTADAEILRQDRMYQQKILILSKRISNFLEINDNAPRGWQNKLLKEFNNIKAEYDQFLNDVKLNNSEIHSMIVANATPIDEIQLYIDDDVSVLEYYISQGTAYVWLVTNKDIELYEIKKATPHLSADSVQIETTNLFFAFNTSFDTRIASGLIDQPSRKKSKIKFDKLCQDYYKNLIGPIEKKIKTNKVVIVPHGVLHKIPFACLSDGTQYLAEKYDISFLPSMSTIEHILKKRKPNKGRFFALANPITKKENLKFAAQEVKDVADLFSSKELWFSHNATESRVKERASLYDVIHFACHANFDEQYPLQSGLFLSHDSENDGFLQIHEVFRLNLKNANLVTLSACETALSKLQGSEDWIGLSRGFLYAGTSSILATLWSVDDKSTSIFMKNFYKNWQRLGMSKPEALRQAQLQLKSMPQYASPYYWAPFVIIGDWK
ncbi:CHAT domain-containing protein [Thermodesulfobacteriota bacterium]